MFSPKKAAEKASVSRKTIMNAIKAMQLKAHRNNENYWVIHPTDLANWMKGREKQGDTPPTYPPTESITDTITQVSPIVPPQVPPYGDDFKAQFELKLSQQELAHTKEKLERVDLEVTRLRSDVTELKADLREARQQTADAWAMVANLTARLEASTVQPIEPVLQTDPVVDLPEEGEVIPAEDEPFILTADYLIQEDVDGEDDDIGNIFDEGDLTEEKLSSTQSMLMTKTEELRSILNFLKK